MKPWTLRENAAMAIAYPATAAIGHAAGDNPWTWAVVGFFAVASFAHFEARRGTEGGEA